MFIFLVAINDRWIYEMLTSNVEYKREPVRTHPIFRKCRRVSSLFAHVLKYEDMTQLAYIITQKTKFLCLPGVHSKN